MPTLGTRSDVMFATMTSKFVKGNVLANLATTVSAVNPCSAWYFQGNNIYTPGQLNSAVSFTMPAANGFSELSVLYSYWQVHDCSIRIKLMVDQASPVSGVTYSPISWILGCVGNIAYANMPSQTGGAPSWDLIRSQSYFTPVKAMMTQPDGPHDVLHFEASMSPAKISGALGYYDLNSANTTGNATTIPLFEEPVFCLLAQDALTGGTASNITMNMEVEMTFKVRWNQRRIASLSREDTEALEDSKEEKKYRTMEEEEDMAYTKLSSLSLTPPQTPPPSRTLSAVFAGDRRSSVPVPIRVPSKK